MSIAAIVDRLHRRLGLLTETLGPGVIPSAVERRWRALGLPDASTYALLLAGSDAELAALVDEIVVPETWFFRGGALFAHLAEHIGQVVQARSVRSAFRALSVPCSSGEEPYSLAIALFEARVERSAWSIDGVDVSARLLERARAGRYGELAFRQTEPAIRQRYFRLVEGGWELLPAVREAVRFRQGNVLDGELLVGEGPFDLVFCRNLFIYLHPEARRLALANLERLLSAGGLLCVGHAEPLDPGDARFEAVSPEGLFLYKRRVAGVGPPAHLVGGAALPVQTHTFRQPSPSARADRQAAPPTKADRQAAPPTSLEQARGLADAGKLAEALAGCRNMLEQGRPSAALYSLLGVIHQARQEPAEAVRSFEKALYLEPDYSEALMHLMLLYRQQGDRARAALLERRMARVKAGGEP
jgi:chemotaxis protein methyltransferase WspC